MTAAEAEWAYERVDSERLHERVVRQLVHLIVRGALPPGADVPTETELGHRFGVSRTVVREATRILVSKGLIGVRHGSGMWVQPREKWESLSPVVLFERVHSGREATLLDELLEVRRLVEVEVAGLAALRRRPEALFPLETAVDAMRRTIRQPDAYAEFDVAFHEGLFVAARNSILREAIRPVSEVLKAARTLTSRQGHLDESLRGHIAILAAVQAGDDEAARASMRAHIARFEADIKQSLLAQAARGTLTHTEPRRPRRTA